MLLTIIVASALDNMLSSQNVKYNSKVTDNLWKSEDGCGKDDSQICLLHIVEHLTFLK